MNLLIISPHILKMNQLDLQLNSYSEDFPEIVCPTVSTGLLITTSLSKEGRVSRLNWLRKREDLLQMTFNLGTKLLYNVI